MTVTTHIHQDRIMMIHMTVTLMTVDLHLETLTETHTTTETPMRGILHQRETPMPDTHPLRGIHTTEGGTHMPDRLLPLMRQIPTPDHLQNITTSPSDLLKGIHVV